MSLKSVVIQQVIEDLVNTACIALPGAFVEVGVYKGGTAWHLTKVAEKQERNIYLFDTFEGMPYSDEDKGDFHIARDFEDTSYEEVKETLSYAQVVKGIFPGSAVPMENIAFAHIDCDQYQSITESVNYLLPLMVDGGIIWFDDAPDLKGALNAVNDLFGEGNYSFSKTNKIYKVVDKK